MTRLFSSFKKAAILLVKDKKGSILFFVLLITLAFLTLGGFLLSDALDEILIAKNYELKVKAHYLAEAGAEAGLALIRAQPDYFMQEGGCTVYGPIYLNCGGDEEQQSFMLEWIPPDPKPKEPSTFEGDPQYYTLYSIGYYHCGNLKGTAGVKAFFEINIGEEGTKAHLKSWSGW